MNTKGFAIEFWDEEKNTPLVTLHGASAKWLAQYSHLIQTLLEIEPNAKGLTIPVSFATDRIEIFRKLLNAVPMGKIHIQEDWNGYQEYLEYYPLGPLEEADIQREIDEGKVENVHLERRRVIEEVAGFLMLDPEALRLFIIHDRAPKNNYQRQKTRRNAKASNKGRSLLNENQIERYISNHKNYLYGYYKNTTRGREKLKSLLSKENLEERRVKQHIFESEKRRRNSINNNYPNFNNYGPFNALEMPNNLPFKNYHNMTPIEFENYLRSLRGEPEKGLPYQTNINLRNFFGSPNNI